MREALGLFSFRATAGDPNPTTRLLEHKRTLQSPPSTQPSRLLSRLLQSADLQVIALFVLLSQRRHSSLLFLLVPAHRFTGTHAPPHPIQRALPSHLPTTSHLHQARRARRMCLRHGSRCHGTVFHLREPTCILCFPQICHETASFQHIPTVARTEIITMAPQVNFTRRGKESPPSQNMLLTRRSCADNMCATQ